MLSGAISKSDHVKNTNAKRLMSFVAYCEKNPSEYYDARPEPNNINIWFVKIKNLSDEYATGEYIMKIHFTEEYPFKPPDYFMLTPSGRFEINKKICFSNSGYHSESWSPLWGIHQIIMGMISFFYERTSAGISHISSTTPEQRANYALDSVEYNNKHLKSTLKLFNTALIDTTLTDTTSNNTTLTDTTNNTTSNNTTSTTTTTMTNV
jgi:ubiquitin-protein ligase